MNRDLTCRLAKDASTDDVNAAFRNAAEGRMNGVLGVTEAPLVSSDIIGDSRSCVFIPDQTNLLGKRLVKVMGWYDNEWAFSRRLIDMIKRMA